MVDYTTPIAQPTVYQNTLGTIHDCQSLFKFYELMFDGNPLILITVVFVGLYVGIMLYETHTKQKEVKQNDCNKN